jgi:arylsulfatase A-like enzyme
MFRPGLEKLDQTGMDTILSCLEKIDRGRPFALFLNTPGDLLWRDNIPGRTGNKSVEEMVSQYDANITNADDWLGKLFKELRARNLMDEQTLVVISSDRGASLGEHGAIGQERLYQESTRVPLILHWPGRLPSKVIKSQVRTVDVVPTIFDLFGIPMPGQVQGASLRPMLDAEIDLSAFIENSVKEPASGAENIRLDQALCDPLWLYYQTRPEPMLFSLANDRSENINLLHFPEQLFANLPGPARDQKLKQIQSIHEFLSADVKNYNYYNLRHLRKFSGAARQD